MISQKCNTIITLSDCRRARALVSLADMSNAFASLRRDVLLTSFSRHGSGGDASSSGACAAAGGKSPSAACDALARSLRRGEYEDVLRSDVVRRALGLASATEVTVSDVDAHYAAVSRRVVTAARAERDGSGDEDEAFAIAVAGVAALYIFVRSTVTGPRTEKATATPFVDDAAKETSDAWDAYARERLSLDGEDLLGRCDMPQYLLLARIILLDRFVDSLAWVRALDVPALTLKAARAAMPTERVFARDSHDALCVWFAARVAITHQRALAGQSPTLRGELLGLHAYNLVTFTPVRIEGQTAHRDEIMFESMARLEASLMEHQYGHVDSAYMLQRGAAIALGLSHEITGALGYRTVHQQNAKTQLVLNVDMESKDWGDSDDEVDDRGSEQAGELDIERSSQAMARIATELVGLSEDGSQVLTKPRLVEGAPPSMQLPSAAQAVLIAAAITVRKKQADDGLRSYEMAPYTEFVGSQEKSQPILRAATTVLTSRHERDRARTRERSLLVLEDLVQTLERAHPKVSSRMRYVFSTWFPPAATLKKELGEQLVSIGMVGAALELFEEVELWDPLIVCLSLLGKKQQAADLVRRRLDADDRNPKLWCALGDALDDEQYYWKAWDVSGERNARARRSLARRAAAREDWAAAAEHWMSALKINPLFPDGWFSGGYACLKCDRTDEALAAFVRCTQIDVENGQAWNNVAALSIRLERFTAAHTALCEAIKHQRTSWHTWENHAMVCAKVGKFATSALALLKVLELTQGARVHIETIQTLVERVREAREDPEGAKWIQDAANWDEEEAAAKEEEEESWANTEMGDLAADMLEAFSGIELPSMSYAPKTESAHPSGMPRVALQLEAALEQVLVRSATGGSAGERKVKETSQIWALMAEFKTILGQHEEATDARLKSVRALDSSGWRRDIESYEDYAVATKFMVNAVMSDIEAGRGGSADSLRLHLKSVVKVGEKQGFEESDAYAQMSSLLEKVSST